MKNIKIKWLNLILHISSRANRAKNSIVDGGMAKTFGIALKIIMLEAALLVISLPVYIFISPGKFSSNKKEVEKYRLKRIVSLVTVSTFIIIFLVTAVFSGGLFFAGPISELRADSTGWSFDNVQDYIYDSSKIQIIDGMALFNPASKENLVVEGISEETDYNIADYSEEEIEEDNNGFPEDNEPQQKDFEELPAEEQVKDEEELPVEESGKIHTATIQPVNSLLIPNVFEWNSFIEVSSKNGGEVYYQLSDDDGTTWYYWDGDKWANAGSENYSTASTVNEKIKKFPVKNGMLMFKAFFVGSSENKIQLLDISVGFSQKEDMQEQPEEEMALEKEADNKAAAIYKENILAPSSFGKGFKAISAGIIKLMEDYYNQYGKFPRSWGGYNFTDIGLTASDWESAIGHIIYAPTGDRLQIKPEQGYGFEAVRGNGETVKMSYKLKYNFMYYIEDKTWYYHKKNTENIIDISTFRIYSTETEEFVSGGMDSGDDDKDQKENMPEDVSEEQTDVDFEAGGIDSKTGENKGAIGNLVRTPGFIEVQSGATCVLSGYNERAEWPRIYFYDKDKKFISVEGSDIAKAPDNAVFARVRLTLKKAGEFPENAVFSGGIMIKTDSPPEYASAIITGTAKAGETLTALGTGYSDNNDDKEGTALYQWKISDSLEGTYADIPKATDNTYAPVAEDANKFIKAEVTPTSLTGKSPGKPVVSDAVLAVISDKEDKVTDDEIIPATLEQLKESGAVSPDFSKWKDIPDTGALQTWGGESRLFIANPEPEYNIKVRANLDKGTNGGYGIFFDTTINPADSSNDTGYILQFDRGYGEGAIIIRPRTGGYEFSPVKVFKASDGGTIPAKTANPGWWTAEHIVALDVSITNTGSDSISKKIAVYIDGIFIFDFEYKTAIPAEGQEFYTGLRAWTTKSSFYGIALKSDSPPEYKGAIITGIAKAGETLTALGTDYSDNNGDKEGTALYQWKISDSLEGTYADIPKATDNIYAPVAEDANKFIKAEVTPTSLTGKSPGKPVLSETALAVSPAVIKPEIVINSASQKDTTSTVLIDYDLFGADEKLNISLEVFDADENTSLVSMYSLAGDIGQGVVPGNGKSIAWDTGKYFGEIDIANIQIRLIAEGEDKNISDYAYASFALDTKAPAGMENFSGISATESSVLWSWKPVNLETNFKYYSILYSKNIEDLENETSPAMIWNVSNDKNLSDMETAFTIIDGLAKATNYYAKIWAFDNFGNKSTVEVAKFKTITGQSEDSNLYPSAPIINDPQKLKDGSGIYVSGIAKPGSSIDLYINGENMFPGFAQTDSEGRFSGTVLLEEGEYGIYVICIDKNKKSSKSSNIVKIKIDFSRDNTASSNTSPKEDFSRDNTELSNTGAEEDFSRDNTELSNTGAEEIKKSSITSISVAEDVFKSSESLILQRPQIVEVKGIDRENVIKVTGRGIPNSEVVVFIHPEQVQEQVLVYKVKVNEDGGWVLRHSQNFVELDGGEHEVYALTLDSKSRFKSGVSDIKKFNVIVNRFAVILSYFDLPTTLLTLFVLLTGIAVIYIWRKRQNRLKKMGQ